MMTTVRKSGDVDRLVYVVHDEDIRSWFPLDSDGAMHFCPGELERFWIGPEDGEAWAELVAQVEKFANA